MPPAEEEEDEAVYQGMGGAAGAIAHVPRQGGGTLSAAQHAVIKTISRYLRTDTGMALEDHDMHRAVLLGGQYVTFSSSESKDMRTLIGEGKGLRLLGFKPRSSIRPIDNVDTPTYLFPAEAEVAGSSRVYCALWKSMLQQDMLAVCKVAPRNNAAPKFVALYAEEEIVEQEEGTKRLLQKRPAGLYAVTLPFADDYRKLKVEGVIGADPVVTPAELKEQAAVSRGALASEEQVGAAVSLIKRLSMRNGSTFNILESQFSNPSLQKFYAGIKSKALGGAVDPWDDKQDSSAPQSKAMARAAGAQLTAFKEALGLGKAADYNDKAAAAMAKQAQAMSATGGMGGGAGGSSLSGKKRTRAAAAEGEEEDAGMDWHAQLASGKLSKATIPQLKAYCRRAGLKLGGVKAELLERVEAHLVESGAVGGGGAGGAAAEGSAEGEEAVPKKKASRAKPAAGGKKKSSRKRKEESNEEEEEEEADPHALEEEEEEGSIALEGNDSEQETSGRGSSKGKGSKAPSKSAGAAAGGKKRLRKAGGEAADVVELLSSGED